MIHQSFGRLPSYPDVGLHRQYAAALLPIGTDFPARWLRRRSNRAERVEELLSELGIRLVLEYGW